MPALSSHQYTPPRPPPASAALPALAQEALQLQVATLRLMRRHGLGRREVAELARRSPTLLRGMRPR
jgi:hypothetical protein